MQVSRFGTPSLAPRRAKVDDLAAQALERMRRGGVTVPATGGLAAQFDLEVGADGVIAGVSYRCSRSCVTLLALCEAAARAVRGWTIAQAAALDPRTLLDRVEGVTPSKADRAVVVAVAVRAAARTRTEPQGELRS